MKTPSSFDLFFISNRSHREKLIELLEIKRFHLLPVHISFRLAILLIIVIGIVNGKSSDNKEETITTAASSNLTQAKSIYSQIVIPMAMP